MNPSASTACEQPRVIKKYPNRRLYDTTTSTYITLAEVKELVMAHSTFEVRDAKTGQDLTRSILLQIILEEEAGGSPMFTAPVLAELIRFYGHAMQGVFGGYLEKNMQALVDLQTRLAEQTKGFTPEMWTQFLSLQPPLMGAMKDSVEQSQQLLAQFQEQWKKQAGPMWGAWGFAGPGQSS